MKRLTAIAAVVLACGPVFGAWEGDGTADIVVTTATTLHMAQNEDFSIAVWFKTTYSGGTGYMVHAQRGASALNESYGVGITAAGNIVARICDTIGNLSWNSDTAGYNDGAWHHVVVTYDRNSSGTIYVDGVADGDANISSGNRALPSTGVLSFYIGKQSGGTNRFHGDLEQAIVCSALFDDFDILQLYSSRMARMYLQVEFPNLNDAWDLHDQPPGAANGDTVRSYTGNTNGTSTNGLWTGGQLMFP